MQTYDPARRPPYQNAIPAMRHAPERVGPSATPIYDTLYAEYRMAFRTLPGDRSGEEGLRFRAFAAFTYHTGFATGFHSTGPHGSGFHGAGPHGGGIPLQAGAGFHGTGREARQLPGPAHTTNPPYPDSTAHGTPQGLAAHPGHSTPAHPGPPHHGDRLGASQPGTWRQGRRQHGPENLLPAVLPTRPRNEHHEH